MATNAAVAGHWDGQCFCLRDFPAIPAKGAANGVAWSQSMGKVELLFALPAADFGSVAAKDLLVEVSSTELKVQVLQRSDLSEKLSALNGEFYSDVRRELSWWTWSQDEASQTVRFKAEFVKKDHKAWSSLWKSGLNQQHKQHFAWNQNQKTSIKLASEMLVRVKEGQPVQSSREPFVISRESLCIDLDEGQDSGQVIFRIHLDKGALQKAQESVCIANLFGVDVTETCLKVFIRGDERSPIIMGELGGHCVPSQTSWEFVKAPASDDQSTSGQRKEYNTALQVKLTKKEGSRGEWSPVIRENPHVLLREAAPESLKQLEGSSRRPASPDRTGWTPKEFAGESKGKGDAAFKKSDWRGAAVYYTKAISYAPSDEKLYSNRAACYLKLRKFEKALEDAKLCISLNQSWPKAYFRQGQALRGLQRWDDAVIAFSEGKFRDPENPDWDKEIEKTEEEAERYGATCKAKRQEAREADLQTELNQATEWAMEQTAASTMQMAMQKGLTHEETAKMISQGQEQAKQYIQERAQRKQAAMMIEGDQEVDEPPPYRIVDANGNVHPKGFISMDRGQYYHGLISLQGYREPAQQPWIEVWHPRKVRWSQGCAVLKLRVPLPDSVHSASQIQVDMTTTHLRIGTVGDADPIVEGDLERKIEPEGANTVWFIDPDEHPKVLQLTVDKEQAEVYQTYSYGEILWYRLFKDEIKVGTGLFEADLTDLPPELLEKWKREQARSQQQSLDEKERRKYMTEEEIFEETGRNWNDVFAKHGLPARMDTNEDKLLEQYMQ
mmetsp:Transcript_20479/g.47727  ORF Transcript_20479/g.47727 Transcript_20479/m.47727 type:complete len:782 (-) Transcript_20479:51-2396(-)